MVAMSKQVQSELNLNWQPAPTLRLCGIPPGFGFARDPHEPHTQC